MVIRSASIAGDEESEGRDGVYDGDNGDERVDGDERDDGEGAYGDGREATEKSDVESDLGDSPERLRKAVQD